MFGANFCTKTTRNNQQPVSHAGHAEADFDAGMSINLYGSLKILDQCRRLGESRRQPVRLVFTSSVAVFGGDMRQPIDDMHAVTPQV